MKTIIFTMVNWKTRLLYPLFLVVSTASLFIAIEPMIFDSGRLNVTVEEATEGDIPGYIDYTYGSHEYDEYTITAYYPSGQKRVRPFDLSMVIPSDRDKFSMLGPQEIQVVYQKGSTTLKVNVVLPSTTDDHIIVFDTLGGLPIEDLSHISNNTIIELPIPTRLGYVFIGWYDNASFSGNPLPMQWNVTRSMVLYAQWEMLLT